MANIGAIVGKILPFDPTPGFNLTRPGASNFNQWTGTMASPSGRGNFWVGQDGNVYVAGNNGTNSAGKADSNTVSYWAGKGFSQIPDPNRSTKTGGNTNTNQSTNGYYGSGGNGSTSSWTPQNQALYDQSVGEINHQIGRADKQLGTTLANIAQSCKAKII